jgi:Toastrack DUF4097
MRPLIPHRDKLYRGGLALLLIPAGLWAASAGSRLEKTYDTTLNPLISISNVSGKVLVKGWQKSQVHALFETSSPQLTLQTNQMPAAGPVEKIHFFTRFMDSVATRPSADYTLDVPRGASIEITNPEGSVTINQVDGEAWVESVGGNITVTDASGHLAVQSLGAGNIEIVRPSGRVEASTVAGNLHLVSPTSSKVRVETTSGNITYDGDFAPLGEYVMSSYRGDILIHCPESASVEVSAHSMRGRVVNELPLEPVPHPFAGGNSLFGTHNEGRATLELKSYSGTITILPQP